MITTQPGETEGQVIVRDEINKLEAAFPYALLRQAMAAAYDEDREMVVGMHPYFGWVYRAFEDDAGRSELTGEMLVGASGVEQFMDAPTAPT